MKAEHTLTMERIRLHLAHTHASRDCERQTRDVLFYEAKVQAGDQRYELHKVRAEKDLESTVSFHEQLINTHCKRRIVSALRDVNRIKQSRERLEKRSGDLETEA